LCGIVGITADPLITGNIIPQLIDSLKRLEYRGYDSAGFAFIECGADKLLVLKDKGKIDSVVKRHRVGSKCGTTGIAHTRWATHGPPSQRNAHPHADCRGEIAVAHNGIIKNFAELRELLTAKGHRFTSDTDTEVIAHLFEEYISKGMSGFDAFKKVISLIEGTYAIVLIHLGEPTRIYFARHVSPLIIGVGEGFNAVSSDIPSLLPLTRRIIVVRDGEYGYIEPYRIHIEYEGAKAEWRSRIRLVTWSIESAEKGGYPHFMFKEIMEQPRALYETYNGLLSAAAEVDKAASIISSADHIFVTGAGTSYHAGLVFAYYMSTITRLPVIPFIASEYKAYEGLGGRRAVLIAISQSGETIDTLQALRAFKARGTRIVSISNVIDSTIPRESHQAIYTRAGPEIGVAATKTFLTQILALTLLSISTAFTLGTIDSREKEDMINELEKAGKYAAKGIETSIRRIETLTDVLKNKTNMYILGRGLGVPLAYEAALKVKEVSYIHAEAYPAGESKHGPIALIEEDYPVIFIGASPSKEYIEKLQGNVMEMKSRGAFTILIGHDAYNGIKGLDYFVSVGNPSELLAPYAITPPLQLLAYKLAVSLGRDPDKPRNLAKTVTVE